MEDPTLFNNSMIKGTVDAILFQNKEETKEKEENLEITEYKKDSLFCKLKKLIKKIFGIL